MSEADAGALEALLDATYANLRAGDHALLERTVAQTGLLLTGLTADAATLHRLQRKAERNAACLIAATQGLRNARRRLAEVTAALSGTGTYDATGRRSAAEGAAGHLARRF